MYDTLCQSPWARYKFAYRNFCANGDANGLGANAIRLLFADAQGEDSLEERRERPPPFRRIGHADGQGDQTVHHGPERIAQALHFLINRPCQAPDDRSVNLQAAVKQMGVVGVPEVRFLEADA